MVERELKNSLFLFAIPITYACKKLTYCIPSYGSLGLNPLVLWGFKELLISRILRSRHVSQLKGNVLLSYSN